MTVATKVAAPLPTVEAKWTVTDEAVEEAVDEAVADTPGWGMAATRTRELPLICTITVPAFPTANTVGVAGSAAVLCAGVTTTATPGIVVDGADVVVGMTPVVVGASVVGDMVVVGVAVAVVVGADVVVGIAVVVGAGAPVVVGTTVVGAASVLVVTAERVVASGRGDGLAGGFVAAGAADPSTATGVTGALDASIDVGVVLAEAATPVAFGATGTTVGGTVRAARLVAVIDGLAAARAEATTGGRVGATAVTSAGGASATAGAAGTATTEDDGANGANGATSGNGVVAESAIATTGVDHSNSDGGGASATTDGIEPTFGAAADGAAKTLSWTAAITDAANNARPIVQALASFVIIGRIGHSFERERQQCGNRFLK